MTDFFGFDFRFEGGEYLFDQGTELIARCGCQSASKRLSRYEWSVRPAILRTAGREAGEGTEQHPVEADEAASQSTNANSACNEVGITTLLAARDIR